MLNARTLAQASTGETSGASASGGADEATDGTSAAEALRPVEAFRNRQGVIVLSNRPADEARPSDDPGAPKAAPGARPSDVQSAVQRAVTAANAALADERAATTKAAPANPEAALAKRETPVIAGRAEPVAAEASSASLWIAIAAIAIAVGVVAWLLVRRKQRRNTERYAALLAGSEPIAPPPEHVGPFSRRGASAWTPSPAASPAAASPAAASPATRTPFPSGSPTATPFPASDDRSAPPPSGISAPPASERQWLSQRPPRSYKQPPS